MAANTTETNDDVTADDRANELARMIDGLDETDEVNALAINESANVSCNAPHETADEVRNLAKGEGFVEGPSYEVDEREMFLTFDYEA